MVRLGMEMKKNVGTAETRKITIHRAPRAIMFTALFSPS